MNLSDVNIDLRDFEYLPMDEFQLEEEVLPVDSYWGWSPFWEEGMDDDEHDMSLPLAVLFPSGIDVDLINLDTYAAMVAKRLEFHINQFCINPENIQIVDATPRRIFLETVKQIICDQHLMKAGEVNVTDSIKDELDKPDVDALDIAMMVISTEFVFSIISRLFSPPKKELFVHHPDAVKSLFESLNDIQLDEFLAELFAL